MKHSNGTINQMTGYLTAYRYIVVMAFLITSFSVLAKHSYAQGSDLEKTVYKNAAPTKKKSNTSKTAPKKTTKKSASAQTDANKPVARRSSSKRSGSRRNPATKLVDFVFRTPAPGQEVWWGEEKLGASDDGSVLNKSLKPGNYLVSVRESSGNVILKSQLVRVAEELTEVVLISDEARALESEEVAADANPENDLKETIEASEKVLRIMRDYADPMKTNTLSLSDWEFVYRLANTNEINNFTAVQIEAQRWFASGQIELSKGKYVEALTAFGQSKTFMPKSAYPDFATGETYLANGQTDPALQSYVSAIAIDPKFALAHARLGDIYAKLGKSKESAASYTSALINGYDSSSIRYSLAKELMKIKRWDEAATNLEAVSKDAPSGEVFLTLGDLYKELKRSISTYEAYKRATELSPDSPTAFYKLGELLFEEREYDKSKAALERALSLDGNGENINVGTARKYIREAEQKLR